MAAFSTIGAPCTVWRTKSSASPPGALGSAVIAVGRATRPGSAGRRESRIDDVQHLGTVYRLDIDGDRERAAIGLNGDLVMGAAPGNHLSRGGVALENAIVGNRHFPILFHRRRPFPPGE